MTVRDATRLERQRKLAEVLRTQAEAEDRGEGVERQKNWEWTIEENDNWERKKGRKRGKHEEQTTSLMVRSFWSFLHDITHAQVMYR
jgi:hypothetical protein